jgi:hypothetical protein
VHAPTSGQDALDLATSCPQALDHTRNLLYICKDNQLYVITPGSNPQTGWKRIAGGGINQWKWTQASGDPLTGAVQFGCGEPAVDPTSSTVYIRDSNNKVIWKLEP